MTRRIHLVLRSYGGENDKNRPPYYSKLLALMSFIRAASRVPNADVLFLNDGPVPAAQLSLMERFGTVVPVPNGPSGMRASYWYAVTLPQRHREWDDDDLVSLNEDDDLFRPDAFAVLDGAATQIPDADYFSVYGPRPDYDSPTAREDFSLPHGWVAGPDRVVNGRIWFNQPGITSTFTARAGALRRDATVFRHCMIPFRRRFLDHETCLICQGFLPYRGLDLVLGLPGDFIPGTRGVIRTIVLVPFRLALNLHALGRHQRHLLYCLTPNEATHLDLPVISADRDWAKEADTVARWATETGLDSVAATLSSRLAKEGTTS